MAEQPPTILDNTTIRSLAWADASVVVEDRKRGQQKAIIAGINGIVKAGEILTIMGPS